MSASFACYTKDDFVEALIDVPNKLDTMAHILHINRGHERLGR